MIHAPKTLKEFKDLVSEGLSLVMFTAEWCQPCKQMKPHFKKASEKYKELRFITVYGDEIHDKYRIDCVPTLFFFRNGRKVPRSTCEGYHTFKELATEIEKHI